MCRLLTCLTRLVARFGLRTNACPSVPSTTVVSNPSSEAPSLSSVRFAPVKRAALKREYQKKKLNGVSPEKRITNSLLRHLLTFRVMKVISQAFEACCWSTSSYLHYVLPSPHDQTGQHDLSFSFPFVFINYGMHVTAFWKFGGLPHGTGTEWVWSATMMMPHLLVLML